MIAEIVKHGSEARARAAKVDIPQLDVACMLPPVLEWHDRGIEETERGLTLNFSVETMHADQPIRRVWLMRNGRFAWEARDPPQQHFSPSLRLLPGRNVITLLAETDKSRSLPLEIEREGPAAAARVQQDLAASGNLYLLSVGVSEFALPGHRPLRHAHDDALAVFNAFAKSTHSPRPAPRKALRNAAFDAVEASVLVNAQATRSAILGELQRLADRIRDRADAPGAERDVLFVFLAGHGERYRDDPELYFCSHDSTPLTMKLNGVPIATLGEIIANVPGEVVLVLDICNAGRAGNNLMMGFDAEELARRIHAVSERGMYVLGAARNDEKAREDRSAGHGVFTQAVLAALRSERFLVREQPPGRKRAIGMMSLIAGVQDFVPRLTAQAFGDRAEEKRQTPVCRMYGDLVPLVIYRE